MLLELIIKYQTIINLLLLLILINYLKKKIADFIKMTNFHEKNKYEIKQIDVDKNLTDHFLGNDLTKKVKVISTKGLTKHLTNESC